MTRDNEKADEEKRKSAEAMLEGLSTEEQMKRLPNILKLVGAPATTFGTATPPTKVSEAGLEAKKTRFADLCAKVNPTPRELNEKHVLMQDLAKEWKPPTT